MGKENEGLKVILANFIHVGRFVVCMRLLLIVCAGAMGDLR